MKYKVTLQHSEEDCGAACLATVAKYYGKNFSRNHMREVVGTGQLGTTLLGLRRGAEAIGFNAKTVKASLELLDHLEEIPLPTIIHWKGNHWVVFFGKKKNRYIIGDPGIGLRYITREELEKAWLNGIMLLLQKDDIRFYQQEDDDIKGFGHFLRRVIPYRNLLIQIVLMNLTIGILSLAYPFLIQILTDDVLVRGDKQLLVTVAIAVIVMNLFRSSFSFVQSNLIANFAQRLQLGLECKD